MEMVLRVSFSPPAGGPEDGTGHAARPRLVAAAG